MEESRRLTLEEIEERHPDLIPALIGHPHVGFVMAHSRDHGPVVLSALGASYLAEQRIVGDDPLAPFSANAAQHLRRTDGFTNAPDILVNSFFDPVLEEGCAFEELDLLPRRARRPADASVHPPSGGPGGARRAHRRRRPRARGAPGLAHGAADLVGESGASADIGDARELMPAVDQRLLRASPAGRKFLVACVPLGVATALTIVVQATLIGNIVADVFLDHRGLAAVAARPRAARRGCRGARSVRVGVRGRRPPHSERDLERAAPATSPAHSLGDRPGDPATTSGDVTTAAIAGVDALDPYFARYLPQLVLASSSPWSSSCVIRPRWTWSAAPLGRRRRCR